jgi:hypothetical protein
MTTTDSFATDPRSKHDYTIIVDGQKKEVPSKVVAYEQVVELAYPRQGSDPQTTFTVTYRHSEEAKHDGVLLPGKTVTVKKEGTVFNVTRTTKS